MLQPDPSYHLKVHDPVHSVNFLNQQLLTGTASGKIKIFCLSSLRSNFELKASSHGIVFISSDTETLICQDKQGVVKLYDLQKNGYVEKCEIRTEHSGFARCIKLCEANSNLLLTPSGNSDICIYDLRGSMTDPIQRLTVTTGGMILCMKEIVFPSMTSSSSSLYLLAGYESGHLVLFDLKESKTVASVKYDFPVCSVDYDENTNRGILSSPEIHQICFFGIDRTKLDLVKRDSENIELQHSEGKKTSGVSSLKIRTDKKCLFVGSCDGVVKIFSWKSLRKLATLRNHRSEITDIAFSPASIDNFKSNLSAIASFDGSVSLWDIYYK